MAAELYKDVRYTELAIYYKTNEFIKLSEYYKDKFKGEQKDFDILDHWIEDSKKYTEILLLQNLVGGLSIYGIPKEAPGTVKPIGRYLQQESKIIDFLLDTVIQVQRMFTAPEEDYKPMFLKREKE